MRKIIIFSFFLYLSYSIVGKTEESSIPKFCITKHLKDAVKLNLERRPLYSQLTNKESLKISDTLILLETLSYPVAFFLDLKALSINRSYGTSLLCQELEDMAKTPRFHFFSYFPDPKFHYNDIEDSFYIAQIKEALNFHDFNKVVLISRAELHAMPTSYHYHCLYRHIVESIGRSAKEAIIHSQKTDGQSKNISADFIRSQILMFPFARRLDKWAYPLQKKGIPIICQDVPHINF